MTLRFKTQTPHLFRRPLAEVENLNVSKEEKPGRYDARIPRYHEYVEKTENKKVLNVNPWISEDSLDF